MESGIYIRALNWKNDFSKHKDLPTDNQVFQIGNLYH